MRRMIVHDVTQARTALALPGPVTLVGEVGAAGIGWWREMVKLLRAEFPQREFHAVLDCGPAPGLALAALRAGIDRLEMIAEPDVLAKLQAIAEQMGARIDPVDRDGRASPT